MTFPRLYFIGTNRKKGGVKGNILAPLLGKWVRMLRRKRILHLKGLNESKWHEGKARFLLEIDKANGNGQKKDEDKGNFSNSRRHSRNSVKRRKLP